MTKVYIIDNSYFDEIKEKYLPKKLLNKVKHYKQEIDFKNSFTAWHCLYQILKKDYLINLEEINISYNEYNKPYINNICFNISHSNNLIVLCISDSECGIDIEMVDYTKQIDLLINKILTIEEKVCDNKLELFYKKWTQIEAVFKAYGSGIVYSKINEIELLDVYTTTIFDKKNNKYYMSVKNNKKDKIEIIKYK